MKTISPQKFKIYFIVLNLVSLSALANPDPGFPGDGDPGTPLPINNWIIPMFIVGSLLLFYYFKKYQKTSVN